MTVTRATCNLARYPFVYGTFGHQYDDAPRPHVTGPTVTFTVLPGASADTGVADSLGYVTASQFQLDKATSTLPLAAAVPPFFTHTSTLILSPATSVRTKASSTCSAGTTRKTADRKIPCGTFADHPAASGTRLLAVRRFERIAAFDFDGMSFWLAPGFTAAVMSNTDGVNDVVLVPTAVPSTVSVA